MKLFLGIFWALEEYSEWTAEKILEEFSEAILETNLFKEIILPDKYLYKFSRELNIWKNCLNIPQKLTKGNRETIKKKMPKL